MGWQKSVDKEIRKALKGGKPQTVMLHIGAPFEHKVMERMNYAISEMKKLGYDHTDTTGQRVFDVSMMMTFKRE